MLDRQSAPALHPRSIVWTVALIGLAVHALCLAASQCWIYPDSVDYIQLAGGIAERLDFSDELYLIRTPGYPLILAGIFRLFGSNSPIALLVLQHVMAVATAVLTALIAWRLTERRIVALCAGALCACSLQLLAYANLVLTETPYTLVLVSAVYLLIRFVEDGRWRWLAVASLLAGVGYLLRPVALYLLPVCGILALRQIWRTRQARGWWRTSVVAGLAAFVPAGLVAAPWMAASAWSHRSLQATRCLDYVFYLRPVTFDGLDSTQSAAMRDIHAVIAEAQQLGHLNPDADYRDRATVIKAYQTVRGSSFAESSGILGQAGRDLMREHPWEIFVGTFRYAAWMLLSPDPVYRFQPGGSSGQQGRRAAEAELYDVGTYSLGEGSWAKTLEPTDRYLRFRNDPKPLTPLWSSIASWFRQRMEIDRPLVGLGDSIFEELVMLTVGGGILSLMLKRRASWFVVLGILSLHVLASAFLGGPQTRYVAPVKPILCLYAAAAFGTTGAWIVAALRKMSHAIRAFWITELGPDRAL